MLEVLSAATQGSIIERWFGASPMRHLRRWDLKLRLVAADWGLLQKPGIWIRIHLKDLVPAEVPTSGLAGSGGPYPDGRHELTLYLWYATISRRPWPPSARSSPEMFPTVWSRRCGTATRKSASL
ncbi:hypothetical protein [Pseudofrankia sp. DC12]|uniref:hypothetical protein n=1 Tax=Pseudofrankia sp. DC12 TaxID=683315 RepID=UPI000A8744DE|nr:hypothetical protein [Pseudofrankia sp. DC12]